MPILSFLLFIVFLGLPGGLKAQENATVTLSFTDVSLRTILDKIEENTPYRFAYKDVELPDTKNITISVKDMQIETFLNRILTPKTLTFKRNRNTFSIIPLKEEKEEVQVRGIVVDEFGEPIIGGTIQVKGTTNGTITNMDGEFSLKAFTADKTLIISYVGMRTQEVAIKPNMKIVLQGDSELLDEVVVTGMTKMDKRLFTGAAIRLNSDDVKLDGLPDVSRALEGRAAGVTVQNVSGTFGTAPKIRVRGATSIYGSSKPLWVVDGVIMEDVVEVDSDALSSGDAETLISSAIAGLSADDIESFQILKDGSATSIYGAKAMAGVIVVTTKKGSSGSNKISYTGEFTMRMIPSYGDFNIMNSQEQMGIYKELEQKGMLNFSSTIRRSESGVYGKMYELMNTYDPVTGQFMLQNSVTAKNAYLRQAEMRNTDWFNELFSNTIMQNHSVSMSGGTDKTTYYASISAMLDPGWSKASKVNRYTANLNSTYNISKAISLNFIANSSFRKQRTPGTLGKSVDAVHGEVKRDFDINPYSYAMNTSRTLSSSEYYTRNYAPFNILHELENNYMDLNILDLRFQAELKYKPIQGLELSALGALKISNASTEHNITDHSNQAHAYRAMGDATIRDKNPLLYIDPDNPYSLPVTILPEGGIYNRQDNRMIAYDLRASASYVRAFNEDMHLINLYGGMELNSTDRERTNFRGWGRQYDLGDISRYAYQVFKMGTERSTDYYTFRPTVTKHVAFFGNATYSYKGKYVLTGTLRYEGSNKLGRSRSARWLPTWNISAAWNMHEEKFFEQLTPTLSHLTLKASYSLTADRGPSNVSNSLVVIKSRTPWRPSASTQESELYISALENSELTYEKKKEINFGLDMGLLDNRINASFDVYWRDNYDLIGSIPVSGIGGTIDKMANVAEMKSWGMEASISPKIINTKTFKWSTDLIFSYNHTEITKLNSRMRVIDLCQSGGFGRKGYPHRALFSIPFAGLSEDGIPYFYDQDGKITATDVYFQERNKLDFLKYEGPTEPTTMASIGNIFTYKYFKLNVFVTSSWGNKVRLDPVFKYWYSDLDATPKEFKNRWIMAGDENRTNIPVILNSRQVEKIANIRNAYNAYNYSDQRVADGGFIRLKEVSLSYDLPKKWIAPLKVNNLSFKLQATNLLLLYADSKLNGQDPEFVSAGGVATPVPRQFTFTIRLGI